MENIVDRNTGESKIIDNVHGESFKASEVKPHLMLSSKLHEREYSILITRDIIDIVESDSIVDKIG